MIRTTLNLQPKNANQSEVIRYFVEKRVLERSSRTLGFISAELYASMDNSSMLVTATWQDQNSYQRWVSDPWRAKSSEALSQLLDQELNAKTKGSIFQFIHGVPGR
jgi:heme-degrading monooxygenase HmoA